MESGTYVCKIQILPFEVGINFLVMLSTKMHLESGKSSIDFLAAYFARMKSYRLASFSHFFMFRSY